MDDFAAVPGTANGFGLVQGEADAIAPGKRMLSSMSPSIVTGPDGKVSLVLGGAGGPTIITAVFQELSGGGRLRARHRARDGRAALPPCSTSPTR